MQHHRDTLLLVLCCINETEIADTADRDNYAQQNNIYLCLVA